MAEFSHKSVLLKECMEGLAIRPDGIYVDATAGGAGHSAEIAKRLTTGKLIAIDRDEAAFEVASARLAPFGDRAVVVRSNFSDLENVLAEQQVREIDGILFDLGVSSYQLDTPERGFSFRFDAPLNMKMDNRDPLSAYEVVNEYSEEKLKKILYEYGEERFAPRIAAKIVAAREKAPISTTLQLAELIRSAIPNAGKESGHPATRSFQAIRIEVNGELRVIEPTLRTAVDHMRTGGRIAVITFHSIEDRITKETFAQLAQGCICPKSLPICVCHHQPKIRLVQKKPIIPGAAELAENTRSHSAKLRVAEKL